jgi:hypothetical protein
LLARHGSQNRNNQRGGVSRIVQDAVLSGDVILRTAGWLAEIQIAIEARKIAAAYFELENAKRFSNSISIPGTG